MKTKLTAMLALGKKYQSSWQGTRKWQLAGVLGLIIAVTMFSIGRWTSPSHGLLQDTLANMRLEIVQQQVLLEQMSREQEMSIDALAVRVAELKAASTRLDALGERLVQLGHLDPEEFDFSQLPPVGGPENNLALSHGGHEIITGSIDHLSRVLQQQFTRLDALQLLLLDRNLEVERTPAGWPVRSGWISSGFGERTDPFTGKRANHEGLDFAGIRGSEIIGVASGVVTWAGHRPGYGLLLEIDHGNGYITRYAHNDELHVKAGEEISAGQVVAMMGSSGRSSSPHVHFEVLYHGEPVNPYQFVKTTR